MGKNYCVGGSTRPGNNYLAIQKIFYYCRTNDIGEETIDNLTCHSILIAQDLEKNYTFDKRLATYQIYER